METCGIQPLVKVKSDGDSITETAGRLAWGRSGPGVCGLWSRPPPARTAALVGGGPVHSLPLALPHAHPGPPSGTGGHSLPALLSTPLSWPHCSFTPSYTLPADCCSAQLTEKPPKARRGQAFCQDLQPGSGGAGSAGSGPEPRALSALCGLPTHFSPPNNLMS